LHKLASSRDYQQRSYAETLIRPNGRKPAGNGRGHDICRQQKACSQFASYQSANLKLDPHHSNFLEIIHMMDMDQALGDQSSRRVVRQHDRARVYLHKAKGIELAGIRLAE
jgi:hypothetical protein